jgi:hypothetical protein
MHHPHIALAMHPPLTCALPAVLALALLLAPAATQCLKTQPGERCAGAEGYSAVPWLGGCCVGSCEIDAVKGWGKWCSAGTTTTTTAPVVTSVAGCVKTRPGERCVGAEGYPAVPWLGGCCVGTCEVDAAKGWGKWCPAGTTTTTIAPVVTSMAGCAKTPPGKRCAGAEGYPAVPWLGGCCVGSCDVDAAKGWGKWCSSTATTSTSAPGSTATTTMSAPPGAASGPIAVTGGSGTNYYGMTYSPFGLGDAQVCPPYAETVGDFCLPTVQIARDLAFIGSVTRRVRTYSIAPCVAATKQILTYARATGMKVMLGLWLANETVADDAELGELGGIVKDFSDVISEVLVSNEFLFMLVSTFLAASILPCESFLVSTFLAASILLVNLSPLRIPQLYTHPYGLCLISLLRLNPFS